jgi:uncharacterized protein
MNYERNDIQFYSGENLCKAWLYLPDPKGRKPLPCIIMAHGLGLTRDASIEPYAEKFVNAGFSVLLFDYRHFGGSEGLPRQLFSVSKQLKDWHSAIRFVREHPLIDANRIGLWGTSFSGGHVVRVAASDGQIAGISAQGPRMDAAKGVLNYLKHAGWFNFMKLGLLAMVDKLKTMLHLQPIYIPIVSQHGGIGIMNTADAMQGIKTIVPEDWRNEICAQYALLIGTYRPVAYARKVTCPALIQVCKKDQIVSPQAAVRTAKKIPNNLEKV